MSQEAAAEMIPPKFETNKLIDWIRLITSGKLKEILDRRSIQEASFQALEEVAKAKNISWSEGVMKYVKTSSGLADILANVVDFAASGIPFLPKHPLSEAMVWITKHPGTEVLKFMPNRLIMGVRPAEGKK